MIDTSGFILGDALTLEEGAGVGTILLLVVLFAAMVFWMIIPKGGGRDD